MKKITLFILLGSLSITALNQVHSIIINNSFDNNINESIFSPVDWNKTKEEIKKIIDLMNKTYVSNSDKEILEKTQEKALDYVENFASKNSTFENSIIELKNEEKEFKKAFEVEWDNSIATNLYFLDDNWSGGPKGQWLGSWMGGYKGQWLGSSGTSWVKPPITEWVDPIPIPDGEEFPLPGTEAGRQDFLEKWVSLENFGYLAQGTGITFGLIAAALWALVWLGGVTAYWATLATTISGVFSVLSLTTKAFVAANKYIYEETKSKALNAALAVIKAAKGLVKQKALIDFGFLMTGQAAAVASGWMLPLLTSILQLGIFITSYYFYFVPPA